MNVAPSGTNLPSGRGDDTQGMRRHLLQDLERQWLDAWRVVDQASSAGTERPADPRSPESTAPGSTHLPKYRDATTGGHGTEAARSLPSATVGANPIRSSRQAGSEVDAALPSCWQQHDDEAHPAPSGDARTCPAERLLTAGIKQAADAARAPGMSTHKAEPLQAAADDARDTDSAEQDQTDRTEPASARAANADGMSTQGPEPLRGPADDVGDADPVVDPPVLAGTNLGNAQPGEPGPFSLLAVASADSRIAGRASAEQPVHAVTVAQASTSRWPIGSAPNASSAQLEDGPDARASAASRQAKPPATATDDQGPQRIMLRELSEQEVLASLRDAFLTTSQSQFAAQGLARALMEAGYARVQVVVNGKPALAAQPRGSMHAGEPSAGSQPTYASQDKHHGH